MMTLIFSLLFHHLKMQFHLINCSRQKCYYDNDDVENHRFVRECPLTNSIILAKFLDVPIWKTHGTYTKQTKRGYNKHLCHQRNKQGQFLIYQEDVW